MKDLRHPAKPIFHNESDVDVTINPENESDAEEVGDYHTAFSAFCLDVIFAKKNVEKMKLVVFSEIIWIESFCLKYLSLHILNIYNSL